MIIFSDARYANVQSLQKNSTSHLVRCDDKERGQSVLMRIFFTSDDAEKSLILTEAAVLRKTHSPLLATVYDVGTTTDEYPFFTFEDVGGVPLQSLPAEQMHSSAVLAEIVQPVLALFAQFHALYRTLLCVTPATIRLVPSSADVSTGASARAVRLALDGWMASAGKPSEAAQEVLPAPYTPPALGTVRLVDGRADLYAFGATLFEVLTGTSFEDIASVAAPGMASHLLLKIVRAAMPSSPDDVVNTIGFWLSGLVEPDRSMRFLSAREAAEFLVAREFLPVAALDSIPETPSMLAPVHPVGMDTALGTVVNSHFEESELPVIELSGEAGIGKTMFLKSLANGRASVENGSAYVKAEYVSALTNGTEGAIQARLVNLIQLQQPALLLIDDAEYLSDDEQRGIQAILAAEAEKQSVAVRVVAAHRTQLPVFKGAKAQSHTLARLNAQRLPMFCAEMLGRCAFTNEFYKELYATTKGHPLFVEETLRFCARNGFITRSKRMWSEQAHIAFPQSLHAVLVGYVQSVDEISQKILAALAATPSEVMLYELADIVDASTQVVMRSLLSLAFNGFVRFERAYASVAHELYREALIATLPEFVAQYQESSVTVAGSAPELLPTSAEAAKTLTKLKSQLETAIGAISQQSNSTQSSTEPANSTSSNGIIVMPSISPASGNVRPHASNGSTHSREQLSPAHQRLPIHEQATPRSSADSSQKRADAPLLESGVFAGSSEAVQRLRRQVQLAAQHDIPALIEGQIGSGKEEVSAAIHALSSRAAAPFHQVVCSDFSAPELEQYLFGDGTEAGLLTLSGGGTVFVDDITSASQQVQSKLLRFAQAHTKTKVATALVGKTTSLATALPNVRLLIGCERYGAGAPEQALQEGRLRAELFFVISSLRVLAPSLEERRDDIPALMAYFLDVAANEFSASNGAPPRTLTNEFSAALKQRRWSANLLELESLARRMVLMPDAEMMEALSHLPTRAVSGVPAAIPINTLEKAEPRTNDGAVSSEMDEIAMVERATNEHATAILSIDDAQKEHILRAMELTGGNKTKAAQMLRIKRTTLIARMKKFGMMP